MGVNHLSTSQSPYLRQHADNPVHWWEWGTAAFQEAERLDRPVVLSIGYATCHWCHVMAHESFEDPALAQLLNDNFIAIKVDREERPDVDAVYMRATQAMTGQGGWPLTCVLTPDGTPFFAGTYFPSEPRDGLPSFSQVLESLAQAWRDRRGDVVESAAGVRTYLEENIGDQLEPGRLDIADLDGAVRDLQSLADVDDGGFGDAPEFPPAMVLEFMLRSYARTGDAATLSAVEKTCEAMARGGIHDQLGGGFARYSVDRHWRVPHFEKTLYDNAQLLGVYLHWWRVSGNAFAERIARSTARFIIDELRTDEGGFASGLDADTEGREGTYYVWNPNQLMRTLGAADGAWATGLFKVTAQGTFERGFSTLQLPVDPEDSERFESVCERLRQARASRTRPVRDDKIVAAWNGLAIVNLIEAGVLLKESEFVDAAIGAAELLARVHLEPGFVRTSLGGERSANPAMLEDHALVASAFGSVLAVTADAVWLDRAAALVDRARNHFADPRGGFFDTADDAEELLVRPKDVTDNVTPSGTSALGHAAAMLWAITSENRWRDLADAAFSSAAELAIGAPRHAAWTLAGAEDRLAALRQVLIVGEPGPERDALHRAALMKPRPGLVMVGRPGSDLHLFTDRPMVNSRPAAYVCEGFVCGVPQTDPAGI